MSNNPIRVLIVDDEAPARDEIRHLLNSIKSVNIVAEAKDSKEVFEILQTREIDLILLDIELPGRDGIEIARDIIKLNRELSIIFITAYNNFALNAFEVNAVDYLLKPVRFEKLKSAIDKIERLSGIRDNSNLNKIDIEKIVDSYMLTKQNSQCEYISVYNGDQIKPIKKESILFAEARGRFVWIVTSCGEFKTGLNFKDIQEILQLPRFFCCHRSFIVNLDAIEAVDLWVNNSYKLKITDKNISIPVSRSKKDELQKILGI